MYTPKLSPSELEDFITGFLQQYPCEAVAEIKYCRAEEDFAEMYLLDDFLGDLSPLDISFRWRGLMINGAVATALLRPGEPGHRVPISLLVLPPAISYQQEELISIIRDHEYVHAQDWFVGIPISPQFRISHDEEMSLDQDIIRAVMEVRAYRSQLKAMPEELKNQLGVHLSTSSGYSVHRFLLERALQDPRSSFEEKVIREFLSALDQMI